MKTVKTDQHYKNIDSIHGTWTMNRIPHFYNIILAKDLIIKCPETDYIFKLPLLILPPRQILNILFDTQILFYYEVF